MKNFIKNQSHTPPSAGQPSRLSKEKVGQASRLSDNSWRRHLPHFQILGGYYFITFATYGRQLLQPSQKDCIYDAIRFLDGKKYELFAAVVLNDHVHIVIRPVDTLPKIMHSIKSFTKMLQNAPSCGRG